MNCRTILIILIWYLPFTAFTQGEETGWKEAGQLPVGHVRNLFETNSGILYAASEESYFRSTNASGDSWIRIDLPKPFTINYIYEYDTKLLVGTDKHGIYEFFPNEQDPKRRWINITDKVFEKEKLKGENLSVNAITSSGDILLANVYHEGNPSHGGSHSRIYLSPDRGVTWKQAGQFDPHNFVFSFTIDNTNSRIIASTLDGILTASVDTSLVWTTASPLVAKKIISIGATEFIGLPVNTSSGVLFRSTDNGTTWAQIPINDARVKTGITDISWGFNSDVSSFYLYASTYDGIYKITRDNLINSGAWEDEYSVAAYISNIRTKSTNKFATAETGVLRRLSGDARWTRAENGLKINYVYEAYANNKYVLAVTDNGLYRSTTDLITKKFNWEPVARDILVVDSENRFLETRRAAIASRQIDSSTEEIFVATNNGIIRSKDSGISWVKSSLLPVVENPLDKTSFVYYQENIQSMMYAGNDLYAVAYETPFILKNREGAWKEIKKGLPFVIGRTGQIFYNGIIRGMQEVAGEVYLYWEDYTSSAGRGGHDIWTFPDLKGSGIYKFDSSIETWVAIKSLAQEAKVHGFVAHDDNLIFSSQNKDNTYTFHSFNVKTQELQQLNNPISEAEVFIEKIYNRGGNLFMTNTGNRTIFVSADGGKVWKSIDDAPSTVSSLAVSNSLVYAGITGNGMWYRNFHEFFPTLVEEEEVISLVEAGDNNQVTESSTDTISIILNQNIPGTTVTLFTRSLTRDNWQQRAVPSDDEKFSIKLPHDQFDEVGLAYYWAVTPPETYQNPTNPVVRTDIVKVAIQYPKGFQVPEKLKMNKNPKKTPYLMLSFPLVSDNSTVQAMLEDELNLGGGNGVWRLVSYENKDDLWTNHTAESLLDIGQGYWLAATKDINGNRDPLQITTSSGKTVANLLKADSLNNFYYEIPLKANDWTQIGNPLLINIDWEDVRNYPLNKSLNLSQLFTYTNTTRGQDGKLAKFSGGYIKNETSETVLRIPVMRSTKYNDARKSAEQEILEDATLVVGFSIESQEMICKLSGLGIHAGAQEGLDKFDLVVPPSPGSFPTMRFTTGDLEKQVITRSIVPPQGEGQEWEFTITEIEKEEKVTLNWQGLKIEEGKALWLHDLEAERKVDMLSTSRYQFTGTRRFRVYYGTEQYLKAHLMPEKSLLAVYPNPISERATISFTLPEDNEGCQIKLALLDARGSHIHVIHESKYNTGFHELEWSITDFAQKLPQGLYIIELQISSNGTTQTYYQKVIKR